MLFVKLLNEWMPIVILSVSILSFINLYLFIKLLNKFDKYESDFINYISEIGNERILIYKKIDEVNKKTLMLNRVVKHEKR
jgi:hypothetical protein|tara:strand:- start:999 stop:1241 length:243 start_codon:yes stop_codon:yes gene_type:complete